jgi:ketopantoate reductase
MKRGREAPPESHMQEAKKLTLEVIQAYWKPKPFGLIAKREDATNAYKTLADILLQEGDRRGARRALLWALAGARRWERLLFVFSTASIERLVAILNDRNAKVAADNEALKTCLDTHNEIIQAVNRGELPNMNLEDRDKFTQRIRDAISHIADVQNRLTSRDAKKAAREMSNALQKLLGML